MSETDSPATAAVDTVEPEVRSEPPPETVSAVVADEEPGGDPAAIADAAEPEPAVEPAAETAAKPAAAEPAAQPDPVLVALERLDDRLEESQRLLARQSEIATSLHAENQRLKAGELVRAQLPLVRDIISVHDVLGQILDATVESTAAADLELTRGAIVDALARNGIEKAHVAVGDALDPRRHKIVGIAAIDDPDADRTIAEIVKIGFAWDDATTIRATDVRVYKHTPAPPPPPPAASSDPAPGAGDARP
jgi:molecular chaperone GrpE (heat shock protein)